MEGYDASTMGYFDEVGNYWEPGIADDEQSTSQLVYDERYAIEEHALANRDNVDNLSLPSSSASELRCPDRNQRRIGLLDSEQPQRRPHEAPLFSAQPNDGGPLKGQFRIPNPENSRKSGRTLLPPPPSSLDETGQPSTSSARITGDDSLYGASLPDQRPYGAPPIETLLDGSGNFNVASAIRIFGSEPPRGFSMEGYTRPANAAVSDSAPMQNLLSSSLFACTRERPPLLSDEQREKLEERRELLLETASFDLIEGPLAFESTFDLSYSLAVFDKAYEYALWDYDPKFSWDYLPGTKRGTVYTPLSFTVDMDYLEEEFKWKKFAAVQEKHWREEFIPKVLEEKRLRDAGLLAERKPNPTSDEAICDFMLEKLEWADDTCTVEYCSICDIEFRAVMPSIQHYESSAHDRAVKHFIVNEMRAYGQVTPEQLRTPWMEVMLNRIMKKIKVKPDVWYCSACNIPISSLLMAKQHLKGTAHRRKLNGLPPVQKLPFHLRNQYQDVCILCSTTLNDETAIEAHISSVQHIAAVRAAARTNTAVPPGPSGWVRDQHLSEYDELGPVGGGGRGGNGNGGGGSGRGGGSAPQYHAPTVAHVQGTATSFVQGGPMRIMPGEASQISSVAQYSLPYHVFFQPPPPPPPPPSEPRPEWGRQTETNFACELCHKKFLDDSQMKLHLESFQHHLRLTQATKNQGAGRTVSTSRGRGHGRVSQMPVNISEDDDPNLTVASIGFVPGGPVKKYHEVFY